MTTTKPLIDPTEVAKAVKVLMADGDVVEVRALKASFNGRYPATISGYFNDQAELVKSVGTLSTASGIYLTVNPVNPALLSRACNRLREAKQDPTTSDHDIARRRWLFIDCDATRPAGISASIAEKKDSGAMARVIRDYLVALGWPDPVLADSGNGWHLLFRIDEPADDDGLVKRFLEALSQRFSDDLTKVDTTVFNPARICKLYGTLAGKGDDTPERPHRLSRICTVPDSIEVVTTEQLTALAGESKPSNGEAKKNSVDAFGRFNLETFIDKHLDARKPTDYRGGKRWVLNKCPFNPDHSRGEACITERADGMLGGMCQHESCTWGWKELRAKFDPTYGKKTTTDTDDDETVMPSPIGIGALVAGHPTLAAPVISGLLRRGET
ncbi:MAG: hypothetical protein QGF59_07225, partial [Pirellulaceae bacterium]|nr:hypothetical protein [Pirellulaceae bacterium]